MKDHEMAMAESTNYKQIIFDLDGTLLNTLEDLGAAVNYALAKRAFPLHEMDEYRQMVGHGVRNLVTQALPSDLQQDHSLTDSVLDDFKIYYSQHIDVKTLPYPGIQDLLNALNSKGIKMAIASNKFQSGAEHLVREFFPGIPFVAVLGNREGYPLKPDPEIVEEVLRNSGVSPAETVMVGDSGTDMKTAENGGIEGIAVGWGYRPMQATSQYRLASTVRELKDMLVPFWVGDPVTSPPERAQTPLRSAVYDAFRQLNIPFERVDTDPGITMEDCAHIDAKIGVRIVKTVFLCNRQQTEFYLYVTTDDKPFVTRDFCGALGIPRVSFASAEKLMELTGVKVGATTVLSAVLPSAAPVHLVMDRSVAEGEWFACTDGTATCFVKIRTKDLLDRYLPSCGKSVTFI